MKHIHFRFGLILVMVIIAVSKVTGQAIMPDVLIKNPIKEQLNYLEEHTRIYENYRAIREDMFQKVKQNVSDTLADSYNKIKGLKKTASLLNQTIDSLNNNLSSTKTNLDEIIRTKNSINVIGLEINKLAYNKIMWTIMAGLLAALVFGFLVFKRNLAIIFNTKKEFQELKDEFEAYRKTSREAREKLTMTHFKEIQKLKGN